MLLWEHYHSIMKREGLERLDAQRGANHTVASGTEAAVNVIQENVRISPGGPRATDRNEDEAAASSK